MGMGLSVIWGACYNIMLSCICIRMGEFEGKEGESMDRGQWNTQMPQGNWNPQGMPQGGQAGSWTQMQGQMGPGQMMQQGPMGQWNTQMPQDRWAMPQNGQAGSWTQMQGQMGAGPAMNQGTMGGWNAQAPQGQPMSQTQQMWQMPGQMGATGQMNAGQPMTGQMGSEQAGQQTNFPVTPSQQLQPPPAPKREETGKKKLNLFEIMLIVAVIGFAVWYVVTSLTPQKSPFATITSGTLGSRYHGDCLIIREEMPFNAEGVTKIEYNSDEGSQVYRGNLICNVYSSGFSTKELTSLQDYRDLIKEYQLKLLNSESATDQEMNRFNSDALGKARDIRRMIAGTRGNMANLEREVSAAIAARQNYLKKKYADDQRMTRLLDDEKSQMQRISSWTKPYAAMTNGIVSFYSDGYEYGLTTSNFTQFSIPEVRKMMNGTKPELSTVDKGKTTIYRMINDGKWYVLMLIRDATWTPVEGQTYSLKLESFRDTEVEATVMSFTRTGNELLIRMSVQSSVHPVLYIRTCEAELGDSMATLMVPQEAIYVQDNMPGVVIVDGQYQTFIPVNVIEKRDGYVYVRGIQQGVLFEGQTVRLF